MKKVFLLLLPLVLIVAVTGTAPAQIKIDGTFFDWPAKTQLDVLPNQVELTFDQGDPDCPDPANPSYFADLDIADVYATDDADFVYIRIKMNSIADVSRIPTDTSYHDGAAIAAYISIDPGPSDTTGLTWGWWGSGYDYFVQAYPPDTGIANHSLSPQALFEHKQNGTGWDFEVRDSLIGCQVAWNASNNDVEIAIPKLLLLHPKHLPGYVPQDSIAIMIYAGENGSPWRADYASNAGVKGYMLHLKQPGKITIDGLLFDWQAQWQLDVPPNTTELLFGQGDPDCPDTTNPTYFADLDISHTYMTDDEDFVYIRIDMNPIADVTRIPTDTSYHGGAAIAAYISVDPGANDTTGLTWGWWGNGYDYFVQAYPPDSLTQVNTGYQQYIWEHKQNGNGWDFVPADSLRGAWVSWNSSNNQVEMAIPKVELFNPHFLTNFVVPETLAVMIYAGENASPWRADYASNAGIAGYKFKLTGTTGVRPDRNSVPAGFSLLQNYPNPFNPATTIKYLLPEAGLVTLRVFNVLGQEIATLVHGAQPAGEHVVRFNAASLSSGVYFYRLESAKFNDTKKMMVLK